MEAKCIFTLILLLTIPLLLKKIETRIKVISWIGVIVICYIIGLLIGNLTFCIDKEILEITGSVSVCLAISVLLLGSNFQKWIHLLKSGIFSFLLSVVSVVISSVVVFHLIGDEIEESWKVSGMMIGVFTGGTPNMSAIGIALDVKEEVFILLNSADMMFGGIYFIFLLILAKKLYKIFLPKFSFDSKGVISRMNDTKIKNPLGVNRSIIISMVLAISMLGISALFSLIIAGNLSPQVIILSITTFGVTISFSKYAQRLVHTYQTAEYLLMIFALSMGLMTDFSELIATSSLLFSFCGYVILAAVLIHLFLAFIFRIDTDTLIITSAASIFGPAFIGPVASAIKNEKLIAFGIIMGLLGYAIGNFLGISVAWILK